MSADGYMINPSRLVKHLIKDQTEQKLIAQIYGGNIDTLIKTTQDIEKKYPGFLGIELNIGCPSPKVLSCGA
jgi:tRNA-dihydrouridine synthase